MLPRMVRAAPAGLNAAATRSTRMVPGASMSPFTVKVPPVTLRLAPVGTVRLRTAALALTTGKLGAPAGIVTSVAPVGTCAGVQLAAVVHAVPALPFQVTAGATAGQLIVALFCWTNPPLVAGFGLVRSTTSGMP